MRSNSLLSSLIHKMADNTFNIIPVREIPDDVNFDYMKKEVSKLTFVFYGIAVNT